VERGRTSVGDPPREGQRYQLVTRVGDIVRPTDGPDTDSPARTTRHPRVHDLVMPTDGGDYRGIVLEVTPTHVRHRCLATGAVHRNGRKGFAVRYRRLVTP
jgi:hypothetical protein